MDSLESKEKDMKLERGDVGDDLGGREGEWGMNMNIFHCICVGNSQNVFF